MKRKEKYSAKVPDVVLRQSTNKKWGKWCKSIGRNKTGFMSRAIEFLMNDLDDSERGLFLRDVSKEDRRALAKSVLKRIANGEERIANGQQGSSGSSSPEADAANSLVDQVEADMRGGQGIRQSTKKKRNSRAG